jgi:hypothetical protein|tara:strand:+ start:3675 stop:4088 length:414 start_codon:yes stop_codon:yes gene_type:complete
MNYKFSNREKILLKILGTLSVIFSVYFIEMKMLSGLADSRDALRSKVQNFNATKQQLAQLKAYRDEVINPNSTTTFSTHLELNNYLNQGSGDIFKVSMLSTNDLLELLRFMHGLNLNTIDIKLVDENNYILSVSFND